MCIAVQINFKNNIIINFNSVYVKPNMKIFARDWVNFSKALKKPFCVGDNFNYHNGVQGCDKKDMAGKVLLATFEKCISTFLNDGSETRIFTTLYKNKSAVDLEVCSPDLIVLCDWNIDKLPLGSWDYYSIRIQSNIENPKKNNNSNQMEYKQRKLANFRRFGSAKLK